MATTNEVAIQWTSVRAFSFDIYGTLVDWNAGMVASARDTILGSHFRVNDDELFQSLSKHSTDVEKESPRMKKSDINAEGFVRCARELHLIGQGEGQVNEEAAKAAGAQHGAAIGGYPAFDDTVSTAVKTLLRLCLTHHFVAPCDHSAGPSLQVDPYIQHRPHLLQRHPLRPTGRMQLRSVLHRRGHRVIQAFLRQLQLPALAFEVRLWGGEGPACACSPELVS